MRAAAILLLVVLGYQHSASQPVLPPARLDITFSGGASFPLGDFGSASSNMAGFASTGYALSGAITYRALTGFDVGAHLAFSSNEFDAKRLSDAAGIPEGIITAGYYFNMAFMATVGFNLNAAAGVDYYGRAYGGLIWCQSPDIKGSWAGMTDVLLPRGSAYPVVWGLGTGVKMFVVDLSMRYLRAEPEYEIRSGADLVRLKQPTHLILLTLGYVIPVRPAN
jgi:hypothetical protein